MSTNSVMELARQGMTVAMMVTMPILAVALFTGLLVSVLQAVTQIQEMTLTFVPKIIGAGIVLVGMGGWMLTTIVRFVAVCFEHAGRVGL
ncbi:MAG: flagellar biosynthetic protein FliQ [Fimbriimonadaceae bacterium]|nr:flagellar biosynthetic protein FliQ [Fimbriimonadaceae bacterium]QYK58974.1 MAG: flagellar biosynthetic protein FliQ [Fimbriimonadaceae bacterium]